MSRPFSHPKPKQHNAHVTAWVSARLRRKKEKLQEKLNLKVNTKYGTRVDQPHNNTEIT